MKHLAPSLFSELKGYDKKSFLSDVVAGLTVAIMLVPQGMAYALLAGLPAVYGLYAALVPLAIYPIFGSSRFLSIGPVALVSIILYSGLSEFADPMSTQFIQMAILCSLMAGVIQMLLAVLKMGFLVNFLSHPVIAGFTSGAAVIICFSQLKHILGISFQGSSNIIDIFTGLFSNLAELNIYALIIGLGSIAIILVSRKIHKSIPSALIVVLLASLAVYFLHWDEKGLAVLDEIPGGLPSLEMPIFSLEWMWKLLPLSLVICLISFIESLAISRTLATKSGDESIDADKELWALGLAKFFGAFFQAYPNTGSFGRSAINHQAGAKTKLSSIFAAIFVCITLLFLTGAFAVLPKAVLGAIIISAVYRLIDVKEAKKLWKDHKQDFLVFMTTMILTLLLGVQMGIMIGIALSILLIVVKASLPHYAVLGELREKNIFRNVNRFAEAEVDDGILIIRYDADLFFANAEHFHKTVYREINAAGKVDHLILDLSSVSAMDSTALEEFKRIILDLRSKAVCVHLAAVKGPIRDMLAKDTNIVVPENCSMHWTVAKAIDSIESQILTS